MKSWLQKALPITLIEWLVITAVVAFFVAILIPRTKWASSGSVTIPVDVVVFDVHSATPIEGALVAIVLALPATDEFELHEYQDRLSNGFSAIQDIGVQTDLFGLATIDQEFRTGASHERQDSHAHTRWYWLLVEAENFGSVAIPLRYESMSTQSIIGDYRLPAYVGLV